MILDHHVWRNYCLWSISRVPSFPGPSEFEMFCLAEKLKRSEGELLITKKCFLSMNCVTKPEMVGVEWEREDFPKKSFIL